MYYKNIVKIRLKESHPTPLRLLSIYIYAFIRRFYPKRVTVHSDYTYFVSMCVPWELNPQTFALLMQCSTTKPQEHQSSLGLQRHGPSFWMCFFSNDGAEHLENYATALILLHWLAIDCKQTECQSMYWRTRRTKINSCLSDFPNKQPYLF